MAISLTELFYEGETLDGTFIRGQLFWFRGHYYICNNVPYTFDECGRQGMKPPQTGWWHEMKPETIKLCEYEQSVEHWQ